MPQVLWVNWRDPSLSKDMTCTVLVFVKPAGVGFLTGWPKPKPEAGAPQYQLGRQRLVASGSRIRRSWTQSEKWICSSRSLLLSWEVTSPSVGSVSWYGHQSLPLNYFQKFQLAAYSVDVVLSLQSGKSWNGLVNHVAEFSRGGFQVPRAMKEISNLSGSGSTARQTSLKSYYSRAVSEA